MLTAHITNSPNKRMAGSELRRLRVAAGLSERKLAARLDTNRKQIERWQNSLWFELPPQTMDMLLEILRAETESL